MISSFLPMPTFRFCSRQASGLSLLAKTLRVTQFRRLQRRIEDSRRTEQGCLGIEIVAPRTTGIEPQNRGNVLLHIESRTASVDGRGDARYRKPPTRARRTLSNMSQRFRQRIFSRSSEPDNVFSLPGPGRTASALTYDGTRHGPCLGTS